MYEVVLDTNVLVAALRSREGASYRLLQTLGKSFWRPNVSVAVALEYEAVLKRPGLLPDLTLSDVDVFLYYLFQESRLVRGLPLRRPRLPDPNDECILEVALESGAAIVTHNMRDFVQRVSSPVPVFTPARFLIMLGGFR